MGTNKKKLNNYSMKNGVRINKKHNYKDNFPNMEFDSRKVKYQEDWIMENKHHTDLISRYDNEQYSKQIKKEEFDKDYKPYTPIIVNVKKDIGEKHHYVFPSLPITTSYMPRCTTAIEEKNFGHFETKRYREYKQLKNIFLSHKLNKYKYVVDPIIYLSDDIFKSECDERYHSLISYIRKKKK